MNKGLLVIAVPAMLVSLFWLKVGWGWRTAVASACVEMAVVACSAVYLTRKERAL